MGDGIGKGGELLEGGLQLRRTLNDAPFQGLVQRVNLLLCPLTGRDVDDRRQDEEPFLRGKGVQTDLGRDLLAVFAESIEVASSPHETSAGVGEKRASMLRMSTAIALRDQQYVGARRTNRVTAA